VALGTSASAAVAAASRLGQQGVGVTVAVVSSLNPSPADALAAPPRRVPPVHTKAAHIESLLRDYRARLEALPFDSELVVVPNACRDDSAAICARLAEEDPAIRTIEIAEGGWGRAVKVGLAAAGGDLLCYTNSARTTPEMLALMLLYATSY